MADPRLYKRFAGQSVNNAGYHNFNWDLFFDGNSLTDVAFASFDAAIAYIGTASKTLYITTQHKITKNTKIPPNVSLVVRKGGSFAIASGKTLTINGHFEAGLFQVFSGAGSVEFGAGSLTKVYPEWFGNIALESADCTTALQAAINAGAGVAEVLLSERTYISDVLTAAAGLRMRINGTLLKKASTTGALIKYTGGGITDLADIKIYGKGTIDGNKANQSSLGSDTDTYDTVTWYRSLIDFRSCKKVSVFDLTLKGNYFPSATPSGSTSIILMRLCSYAEVSDVHIEDWGREGVYQHDCTDSFMGHIDAIGGVDSWSAVQCSGASATRNQVGHIRAKDCGASSVGMDSTYSMLHDIISLDNTQQNGVNLGHTGKPSTGSVVNNIVCLNSGTPLGTPSSTTSVGIQVGGGSSKVKLSNIYCSGSKDDGVRISDSAADCILANVHCTGNGGYGLYTFNAGTIKHVGGDLSGNTTAAVNIGGTTVYRRYGVEGVTDSTPTNFTAADFFGANATLTADLAAVNGTFSGILASSKSASGVLQRLECVNSSNTANSRARIKAETAGSSAGDAWFYASVSGVRDWSWGVTSGGSYKLSRSSVLGTNDVIIGDASGNLAYQVTTDSTSISTGSVSLAGGLGMAKALWVGGLANIAGILTLQTYLQKSNQTGITASTTQTQGQGPLTKDINIVSTVANANDTVTLPAAVAGMSIFIRNNGANTLKIFPASGDAINGAAVNASTTLAAGASVTYNTADTTNWYS